MSTLLKKLGVPKDVRLFFKPYYTVQPDGSLLFPYGSDHEHFGNDFHRVPTAPVPWMAGNGPVIFIAFSVMECIGCLTILQHRFPDLSLLRFIALGNNLAIPEIEPAQQINLVFGRELLGRLADVQTAQQLKGKKVLITYLGAERYQFVYSGRSAILYEPIISLSAVEKRLGLRSGIRTLKPRGHISFLQQLLNQYT